MTLDLSLSPDTAILLDALRAVPYGQDISFAELTRLLGRDVQRGARGHLSSALRIALRDDGAAFMSVRGVGYRRIAPDQAPEIGQAARRSLRRKSRQAVRAMTAVADASNGLSPEAARRLSAEISTHGLLAELASDKAVAHQAKEEAVRAPAIVAQGFLEYIGAVKVAAE